MQHNVASATRADIVRLLGELDDLVIARLIAVGASVAELEEAVADFEFETDTDDRSIHGSRPRVDELRALFREFVDADVLPDVVSPPPGRR